MKLKINLFSLLTWLDRTYKNSNRIRVTTPHKLRQSNHSPQASPFPLPFRTDAKGLKSRPFAHRFADLFEIAFCASLLTTAPSIPSIAQTIPEATELEIPPEIIQDSPVLQKWLPKTPNIWSEIRHDPSFKTRFSWGATIVPDLEDKAGIKIALEDIFLKHTGITFSLDYQSSFSGDRINTGANAHYFFLPLGNFVNIAPLIGYRYFQTDNFNTDGIDLGWKIMLALSRSGAADISLTQSWLNPGSDREVGLFSVTVGYGITSQIRLVTDWELQNSKEDKNSILSIGLQYLF